MASIQAIRANCRKVCTVFRIIFRSGKFELEVERESEKKKRLDKYYRGGKMHRREKG
jgi:hypothetical protein